MILAHMAKQPVGKQLNAYIYVVTALLCAFGERVPVPALAAYLAAQRCNIVLGGLLLHSAVYALYMYFMVSEIAAHLGIKVFSIGTIVMRPHHSKKG